MSRRTQALIRAYVATLPNNLLPTAPIFMTRTGAAYTKNSLAKDFRDIRKLVLPGDTRQLQEVRRTGAVEVRVAPAPRREATRDLLFAGVVAAVFFREEANQIVAAPVPANNRGMVVGSEMIDLGLIIKSTAVRDLLDSYLRKWQA